MSYDVKAEAAKLANAIVGFEVAAAQGVVFREGQTIIDGYFAARQEAIEAALLRAREDMRQRKGPKVVCLCGSTRFKAAFDEANYQETMAGRIVLSVGFYMHATGNRHGESIGATPDQKVALDELHKRKIDLADEVFVLNVGGYIGESTRSEIEYAEAHGKPVRYLEAITALKEQP